LTPARAALRGFGWQPLGRRAPVLTGLDLAIEPGERLLLTGPSGSGKSTILRALAGVLGASVPGEVSGAVEVDARVGLLLQNPGDAVVAARIGRDVAFGPENAAMAREEIWRRVRESLAAIGMPYGLEHPTQALSGGELQRLALAGVLALEPGLLLLDEPTSMLDAANAEGVRRAVLAVVAQTGASLLVVEHHVAPWLAHVDRVVVLGADGHITADTSPQELACMDPAALAGDGVWMPGLPAPTPLDLPATLVGPRHAPLPLRAESLAVELRTRTLRGPVTTPALRGVDAELAGAAITAFTGPSGAGKSTLAAALAGLLVPVAGRVVAPEPAWHRWRPRDRAAQVGWVPQNAEHGFLTSRVCHEVVVTANRLGVEVDVGETLEAVGLSHLADANPYQLSGGEQRRLAIVAALAHRPPVLLLDEPTVGQDRDTWAAVVGWAMSAARAGAAVGVASHDPALAAASDHEVTLERGRVAIR